ncbi:MULTISPECIES: hypothetical protein [Pseudomonas]|uniref:hypothetical protein n=1 Tax=Pseudomonas TaxID=286 RepID=UPI0008124A25|nr:hypothetical protein [Pseudomonas sp. 24 E 13]CRM23836.1 hypothetical protein [Pseudomonas sp. 24 E 13]
MPDTPATPAQHCTIDYLQDTLFGANPLSCECQARITQHGECVTLRILSPWPETLAKAHTLTIKAEGRIYHGVLLEAQASGADELVLAVERQPQRPGATDH